jgi:5-methylcytosine-specific restriction endonuclease McrA
MAHKPGPLAKLLLVAQQEACFYCGGKISFDRSRGWLKATRDHFYPISGGGSTGISNVVLACDGCNNRKRARLPRLTEVLKWNKLAAVWPHIKPIDLEPVAPKKACRRCGQQIPVERLLKTRISLAQTQTCSTECSRKDHNRRTKIRHKQVKANQSKRRSAREQPGSGIPDCCNPEPISGSQVDSRVGENDFAGAPL